MQIFCIGILLLSSITSSFARYANLHHPLYERYVDLDDTTSMDLLYAREAIAASPPRILGAKPIKDTLKCNKKDVCSGEIVV